MLCLSHRRRNRAAGGSHGYLGRERAAVGMIADWIAGKPVPKQLP
jgi:hypothetical protein